MRSILYDAFEQLKNGHDPASSVLVNQKMLYQNYYRFQIVKDFHVYNRELLLDMFILVIDKYLRPGRSPGPDGLMYDYYNDISRLRLLGREIPNMIAGQGFIQIDLPSVVQIPKPNGKIRIISIPNILDAIFLSYWNSYLEPYTEAYFDKVFRESGESLFVVGGRSGFGQGAACSFLNYAVNRFNLLHRAKLEPVVIFIDVANCFPSISHSYLSKVLSELGINKKPIRNIIHSNFKQMSNNPQKVANKRGISQGSPLSPRLCALVVTHCLNRVRAQYTGEFKLRMCTWLDDIAIVVSSNIEVSRVIQSIKTVLGSAGLEINAEKTEILYADSNKMAKYLGLGVAISRKQKDKSYWLNWRVHPDSYGKFSKLVVKHAKGTEDLQEFMGAIRGPVVGFLNYHAGLTWRSFIFQSKCYKFVYRMAHARFGTQHAVLNEELKAKVFSGYSFASLQHNRLSTFS